MKLPPLRTRVRRWSSGVLVVACAFLLAAPMLLGPAFTTVMRILHSEAAHLCMCGMPAGKCGCPECERQQLLREHRNPSSQEVAFTTHCDDDGGAVPSTTQLPYALPAGISLRKSAPESTLPVRESASWLALEGDGPPTPPPRLRRS